MRVIVLGRRAMGERDLLVSLLTAEHGLIRAVARGAQNSKKRFPGLLETGVRAEASLRERRSLPVLEELSDPEVPLHARDQLERMALLQYGCAFMAKAAPQGQPSPKLMGLLDMWLQVVETAEQLGPAHWVAFEAKALTFLGLQPPLVVCGRCGKPHPDAFGAEVGASHVAHGVDDPVPEDVLLGMEILRRIPLRQVDPADPAGQAGRDLLRLFAEWQLGHRIAGSELLAVVNPPNRG